MGRGRRVSHWRRSQQQQQVVHRFGARGHRSCRWPTASVVRLGPAVVAIYQSAHGLDGDDSIATSPDAVPGQARPQRSLRTRGGARGGRSLAGAPLEKTGTGKGTSPRRSTAWARRKGDLVAVNYHDADSGAGRASSSATCAARSPAIRRAAGKLFARPTAAPLFLDEIGKLPRADLQPKLLRRSGRQGAASCGDRRTSFLSTCGSMRAPTATSPSRSRRQLSPAISSAGFLRCGDHGAPACAAAGDRFASRSIGCAGIGWRSRARAAVGLRSARGGALLLREWRDNLPPASTAWCTRWRAPPARARRRTANRSRSPSCRHGCGEAASIEPQKPVAPVPATPARPAPNRDELIAALAQHQGERALLRFTAWTRSP